MINFILLTVAGLLAVIVIVRVLGWAMDHHSTELDDEEEDRITDLYRDR